MKYNQYAYVKTGFNQQVKELIDINFLPRNYEDWSFSDLLANLLKMQSLKPRLMLLKRPS